jgi:hypothetical protein
MDHIMLRRLLILGMFLLFAAPVHAGGGDSLLVVTDDAATDPTSLLAIRNVAISELRKRGATVLEDRRADGLRTTESALAELSDELRVQRVFALRLTRLGQKYLISLDELEGGTLATVYSATLAAGSLEECDIVISRLAAAVQTRTSAENTAELRTVTTAEATPMVYRKKHGERVVFVGLPMALYNGGRGTPYGFSLSYGYEADNFRLGGTVGGYTRNGEGTAYGLIEAAWIPLSGNISPFLGGGLGYMGAGANGGMGANVEAGMEFFRLYTARLLAGVEATIPFFETASTGFFQEPHRDYYPAAFVRLGF